jgi:Aerotolerance regulator N-terminal
MSYLQPWMLWILPAALLPIVIHLLNRLRYKTVPWAAMIFLLKANRAATRRAKIRQYLLLACRVLVLLFLIWAMARPLTGGWIGAAAGGAPEVVMILLDRSASMESRGGDGAGSKREHALSLLAQAAKQNAESRFVFVESVLREPIEIAGGSGLEGMRLAGPTDTAADIPAMLRVALDYLVTNKPGSAELWLASDLQASNWRPDGAEWQDLAARFAGLSQEVRVRILDLSTPPGRNVSVAVKAASLRLRDEKSGKAELNLGLELKTEGALQGMVPLFITRDGTRSQSDVALNAPIQRRNLKFDLAKNEAGWGKVELPADEAPADNVAWFAYSPPVPLHAAIIAEGASALRLQFAAAPDKTRTDRTAAVFTASRASQVKWNDAALGVWIAPPPDETIGKAIENWVEAGGVLLCFPPGGEGGTSPLGVAWEAVESAERNASFRITVWDELDGPLARTESGASLPLARLEIQRRQIPATGEDAHVYASFADGRAFLIGRKVGAGHVFACATLPEPGWSNFGEGLVLLPMVQRLITLGGQRLEPPSLATAGEWKPANAEEIWTAVESDRPRDWRWNAGVYQSGTRFLALNRPETEDAPELVPATRLPELLHGAKLTVMTGAMSLKADRLQSEIWPAMVIVTMLFMCAEMLLATSKAMLPLKPAVKPAATRQPVKSEQVEVAH